VRAADGLDRRIEPNARIGGPLTKVAGSRSIGEQAGVPQGRLRVQAGVGAQDAVGIEVIVDDERVVVIGVSGPTHAPDPGEAQCALG